MSKTSALSVVDAFVKKSNWFRSKKQKHLLEQMAQPQPLTGNIYRYTAALVNIATADEESNSGAETVSSSRLQPDPRRVSTVAVRDDGAGSLLTVMAIQLLAPVSICYSHVKRLDWSNVHVGLGHESGTEFWLGRCLAALFLFGFAGFLRVHLGEEPSRESAEGGLHRNAEIHADRKMRLLIMKDVRLGELMGRGHWWMTVGRIMNFSVSFWCLIAMWLVFHVSSEPKDVVYDSMGLAFIIKLDNVAGDMGARGPSMPDAGSDPPGVSGPEGMNNEAKRKWMKWVIGPAQWHEDLMGIYWALVLGSGAAEKHATEERTESHKVSAQIRNLLLHKAVKIYNDTRHHEKGGDTPHGERKLAKLPDSSWDEMSWYMPNVERGEVSYDEVFHHPAVREYVQSEDFVNYIYAKLGKEYAIGDQIGLAFIRAFQFFGPLTFFLIQIHRKS
ncbi:Uncharacterized protein SCF082_LOCUS10570 [Durusdinium trenchii]|uniref:Uncharacterized protein n=1 Tax=Durusdinium trenchii TaxID=1381693 RepID=A0ABP0J751_9DINO